MSKEYEEFRVNYDSVKFPNYWIELVDGSKVNLYSDTDSEINGEVRTKEKNIDIRELYSSITQKPKKVMDTKGYITNAKFPKNLEVLSFNKGTLKPEFKKVKAIWKYKTRRKIYKLKVQGKEIECTENHSIIISRNNEIMKIKLKDLQKTDKLILIKGE